LTQIMVINSILPLDIQDGIYNSLRCLIMISSI
jgi:hypothetical protein